MESWEAFTKLMITVICLNKDISLISSQVMRFKTNCCKSYDATHGVCRSTALHPGQDTSLSQGSNPPPLRILSQFLDMSLISINTPTWREALCRLILYSLRSVCIFSILLHRHFLGFWQGEFVQQSRASLVGDHLLYSHDLSVWFRRDVLRRN